MFGDEKAKFRKSNMADGRHFENRYSSNFIRQSAEFDEIC